MHSFSRCNKQVFPTLFSTFLHLPQEGAKSSPSFTSPFQGSTAQQLGDVVTYGQVQARSFQCVYTAQGQVFGLRCCLTFPACRALLKASRCLQSSPEEHRHTVMPQAGKIKKILIKRNVQLHHSSVHRMSARN